MNPANDLVQILLGTRKYPNPEFRHDSLAKLYFALISRMASSTG